MTEKTMMQHGGDRRRMFRLMLAAAALALPLSACENVLEVTDPDIVTPDNLVDEVGLQTLRNGALGEFTLAYSGGGQTDNIISTTGLMTDEWMHSGTFTTRFQMEVRNMPDDNGSLAGVFRRLQQARNSLESTASKLQAGTNAATDGRIAEMLMYAGFTYLAFGENYCNGVPFSLQPETGETEFGSPETNVQIFDRAIARFNSTLAESAASDDVANAARVGLGRALVNKGDYAAAASAVASVADGFVKVHNHSSNSANQRNSIFEYNVRIGRWSLGDSEGINGLNFRTAGDPRIQSALCEGCAFDKSEQVPGTPNLTDNWWLTNYTTRDDPVRLATGIEARLIEAEALLSAGDAPGWLAKLNGLRAQYPALASIVRGDPAGTLAPLADPGTLDSRIDLHFRERAFWLFSTGSRLGDMRRLIRQYGRDSETVFPTGPYWKPGANYATDVNLPVPLDEENNPNFTGCLDRNP